MNDRPRLVPHFLTTGGAWVFVLDIVPESASPAAWLLHAPPLGEEMNRSRRVVSQAGRIAAQCGLGVRLLDYHGTGDSGGDLQDASLARWSADLVVAAADLRAQAPASIALWGTRAGALIAAHAASDVQPTAFFGLAPVVNGQRYIRGFTRQPVALDARTRASEADEDGDILVIGGHAFPRSLLDAIAELDLHAWLAGGCAPPTVWVRSPGSDSPPATVTYQADLEGQRFWAVEGSELPEDSHTVLGEAFRAVLATMH